MADNTKIEWTDATWNIITGCSVVSPGCTNCYAMRLAGSRLKHHPSRSGLTIVSKAGPVWTGEVRFNDGSNGTPNWLMQPIEWKRPRQIFVCAHGDLFHENVPDEWLDKIFAVMAGAPQHIFQVLTKRPERMREYLDQFERRGWYVHSNTRKQVWRGSRDGDKFLLLKEGQSWPLPNVWLGTSVEDQKRADERIPDLLVTPAAVRWLSMEPLLGPVDLTRISTMRYRGAEMLDALTGELQGMFGEPCGTQLPKIDWIVLGGESGPGARPMHPDWARSVRNQCTAAGVSFHFKQWGTFAWAEKEAGNPETLTPYRAGKKAAGRLLDGVTHDGMPGHG